MTTTVIIQARMGSTRLPGKVLKVLEGKSVLGHVISRCQAIPSVDKVVVATTVLDEDMEICHEALLHGAEIYRGSKDNVLSRYYEAAIQAGGDTIVRVTSDCPLLDPRISNEVIEHFVNNKFDYVSSGLSQTFPRGLDTEVFTFSALERAYKQAEEDYELEHVTPYIYLHPEEFSLSAYACEPDYSRYRLTLDTAEDWELISTIYREIYNGSIFYWSDVLQLLQDRPQLAMINAHIEQKKLGE
ncbi:glycosyltransferase family protein [Paenibacillus tarimensis]|uniref:glycosyltransferase family protein n=1 Tax=Paenibacillus tarimensis TaxID=416012 RepID=UPI001F25A906|nr:glycosyltransferase family protein [Paenibacillus tarimensis]MCF2944114.1 glycosyltransferase family protein [Paenibacillus tarimensis]